MFPSCRFKVKKNFHSISFINADEEVFEVVEMTFNKTEDSPCGCGALLKREAKNDIHCLFCRQDTVRGC